CAASLQDHTLGSLIVHRQVVGPEANGIHQGSLVWEVLTGTVKPAQDSGDPMHHLPSDVRLLRFQHLFGLYSSVHWTAPKLRSPCPTLLTHASARVRSSGLGPFPSALFPRPPVLKPLPATP